jgi:hypothetical protein
VTIVCFSSYHHDSSSAMGYAERFFWYVIIFWNMVNRRRPRSNCLDLLRLGQVIISIWSNQISHFAYQFDSSLLFRPWNRRAFFPLSMWSVVPATDLLRSFSKSSGNLPGLRAGKAFPDSVVFAALCLGALTPRCLSSGVGRRR